MPVEVEVESKKCSKCSEPLIFDEVQCATCISCQYSARKIHKLISTPQYTLSSLMDALSPPVGETRSALLNRAVDSINEFFEREYGLTPVTSVFIRSERDIRLYKVTYKNDTVIRMYVIGFNVITSEIRVKEVLLSSAVFNRIRTAFTDFLTSRGLTNYIPVPRLSLIPLFNVANTLETSRPVRRWKIFGDDYELEVDYNVGTRTATVMEGSFHDCTASNMEEDGIPDFDELDYDDDEEWAEEGDGGG